MLEAACVLVGALAFPSITVFNGYVLWRLIRHQESWLAIVVACYAIWYVLDWHSPEDASGPSRQLGNVLRWFTRHRLWRPAAAYFPVRLHITDETILKPRSKHILCYHPHGIIAFGANMSFGFYCDPQLAHAECRLGTIGLNMKMPLWRELMLASGMIMASYCSLERFLQTAREEPTLLAIVVGGARESLDAYPGRMDLTLKCRQGVFRIALRTG